MPRLAGIFGPALLLAVGLAATVVALTAGGGAAPPLALDPGPIVRYGLPLVKLLTDLATAVTLGTLLLAVFALSAREKEFDRALDLAAAGAGVWTISAAASGFFAFASVYNAAPSLDATYGDALGSFLTQTDLGRAWLITALAAAALTAVCFAVRNVTALGFATVGAVLAVIPLSQEGHAGDTASHDVAVTAMLLHLVFAAFWVGGLIAIVVLRPTLTVERLAAILPRYSAIALICFIVVAISGFVSATVRIAELPQLLTPYGILVLVKSVALLGLGALGAVQRRAFVTRLAAGARLRVFWFFVLAEVAVMGVASGAAAALARTAPPADDVPISQLPDPTPAEILTDRPLPPELTPERFFSTWSLDLLWALVVAFGIVLYLAGVRRLRRRGDAWPVHRTVLWVLGMLLLLWTTNGVLNAYQDTLFSMHMLAHMLLTMAIPIPLVLSAPITLILRAVPKRSDGSRGVREWALLLVHSKVAGILVNPIVAAVLFAGSLWAFYYTPLFRWATVDHLGHTWMVIHFLITGYLFVSVLVGVDPLGNRPPYPLRLILLLATMAFHAFFGLTIMSSQGLFLADWFGAMGREWGLPPPEDQVWGGGIAWSVGEIPTVALAILVAVRWSREDSREAKRRDRAADRDGDAELEAYNAMLAQRSTRR